MARYQNKTPPHLSPMDETEQGVRIPIYTEKRLSNWKVSSVGGVEARKGKLLGKELGKGDVKDNPANEGDLQHPMVLQDLLEEGVAEADQEGEDQEGDEEESVSYNCNCGVTVMVFRCSTIL